MTQDANTSLAAAEARALCESCAVGCCSYHDDGEEQFYRPTHWSDPVMDAAWDLADALDDAAVVLDARMAVSFTLPSDVDPVVGLGHHWMTIDGYRDPIAQCVRCDAQLPSNQPSYTALCWPCESGLEAARW